MRDLDRNGDSDRVFDSVEVCVQAVRSRG